jgi:hypothetical protein
VIDFASAEVALARGVKGHVTLRTHEPSRGHDLRKFYVDVAVVSEGELSSDETFDHWYVEGGTRVPNHDVRVFKMTGGGVDGEVIVEVEPPVFRVPYRE